MRTSTPVSSTLTSAVASAGNPDPAITRIAAMQRASIVVEEAARDHGLPPGALQPHVDGRVARGAQLRVTVRTEVAVFRLPFVGDVVPSVSVPVEATHVVQVDRYRSFG